MKKNYIIGLVLLMAMALFVVGEEAFMIHLDTGNFLVNESRLDNGKVCSYYTSDGLVCNDTFTSGGSQWIIDYNSLLNSSDTLIVSETWVNESILNYTAITYYNVTSIDLEDGTSPNSLSDIQSYNGGSYNISESAGAPALDVRFNFTGVVDFNQIGMRMKTTGNTQNTIVYLWDYGESDWEEYWSYSSIDSFTFIDLSVFDSSEHISGGLVQLRIYQSVAGNVNHIHLFDWVTLIDGASTFSTSEVDPRSHHIGENLELGNYNLTIGGGYGSGGSTLYSTGSLFLGNDLLLDGDILTIDGIHSNGSLLPNTSNTYNLGNSSLLWKDLYVDGVAYLDETEVLNLSVTDTHSATGTLKTLALFGNVTLSANNTHFCIVGESKLCIET